MSHIASLWRLAAGYLFGTFDYTNLKLTEILPKIVIQLIKWHIIETSWWPVRLYYFSVQTLLFTPFKPGLRWLKKLA